MAPPAVPALDQQPVPPAGFERGQPEREEGVEQDMPQLQLLLGLRSDLFLARSSAAPVGGM